MNVLDVDEVKQTDTTALVEKLFTRFWLTESQLQLARDAVSLIGTQRKLLHTSGMYTGKTYAVAAVIVALSERARATHETVRVRALSTGARTASRLMNTVRRLYVGMGRELSWRHVNQQVFVPHEYFEFYNFPAGKALEIEDVDLEIWEDALWYEDIVTRIEGVRSPLLITERPERDAEETERMDRILAAGVECAGRSQNLQVATH